MDESYEPYSFLYNVVEGERVKFHSLRLIAKRFSVEDFEAFFNYQMTCNIGEVEEEFGAEYDGEVEIIVDKYYKGSKELDKILKQKCVTSLEKDGVFAFRKCGLQCLCEECYNSEMMICAVCRT